MFAAIRERYGIARDDTLKLRDYPTLRHVVGFVEDRTAASPAPARTRPARPPARRRRPRRPAAAPRGAGRRAGPAPRPALERRADADESRPRSWRSSPPRPATRPTCSTPTSTSKPTSASTPSNRPRCSPPSASATASTATTPSNSATTPPCATSSASSKTAPRHPRPPRGRAAAGGRPDARARRATASRSGAADRRRTARRAARCRGPGAAPAAGTPRDPEPHRDASARRSRRGRVMRRRRPRRRRSGADRAAAERGVEVLVARPGARDADGAVERLAAGWSSTARSTASTGCPRSTWSPRSTSWSPAGRGGAARPRQAPRGHDARADPAGPSCSGTRLGGRHGYDAAGATSALGGAVTGFAKALSRERPGRADQGGRLRVRRASGGARRPARRGDAARPRRRRDRPRRRPALDGRR